MFKFLFSLYSAFVRPKRYLTAVKVVFGKSFTFPVLNYTMTAPKPPYDRIQVYNSWTEVIAQRPIGPAQYIDTKKFSELPILLEPGTAKILMEAKDIRAVYEYVRSNKFGVSCIYNGQRKYFRYDNKYMMLSVGTTTDFKAYQRFLDAAAFEASCKQFVEAAQRNARALAKIAQQQNLTAEQRRAIDVAITKHEAEVNLFKAKLPAGFYVEIQSLRATQIGLPFVIPVIVWVAAIVTAGVVIIAVDYIGKKAAVDKQRNVLDNNLANIQKIREAAQAANQGVITTQQYNDIKNAADANTAANNANLTTQAAADAEQTKSGGFLGQLKTILIVGGIIIIGKEVMAAVNKSK